MVNFPMKRQREGAMSPFTELDHLQREMNRLFDVSFPRFLDGDTTLLGSQWAPAMDVYDSKDDIVVKADLPGLTKDEIEINIQENMLTIKGEKKKATDVREDDYVRTERYYGTFHRTIMLPSEIKAEAAKANFKNGVLELTLPKKEEAKPKQITVDVK
ncbi:MAG: Hsp20/alpha crystallin family protein [Candidatus Omnitrophica bacterium]|nr:Hsp20/alpha crystallin family protein [Candidatus Omnitrophota bacterium]